MSLTTVSFSVWFGTTVIANLIRLPYYKDHYNKAVQVSKKDFLEFTLMGLIAAGFIFAPVVWFTFGFLKAYDWQQNFSAVIVGSMLAPISIWFFYRSHTDLKKQWSPSLEIREDHELITNGVYKYTRNPMYFSVLIWSFAQALLIPNFVAGLAAFLSLIPLFLIRLPREEKMMTEHFGQSYLKYKYQTNRLIPFKRRTS